MNKVGPVYVYLFFVILFSSCQQKKTKSAELKTITRYDTYSGVLNVTCDSGLESIIKQHEEVFEYLYDSVQLNLTYQTEKEMFVDFRSKKSTVMLLARPLTEAEISAFKNSDTIYIKQLPVANDAVALIGSKDFEDKDMDVELLKKYFNPKNSSQSPPLVFGDQNSSVVRFVLDYLGYKEKVSANVFALKTNEEVIDYVSKNSNVIGFIPFNLVSDADDERVKKLLERIKILSLRAKTKEGGTIRVSANQSDIITGDYPLIRKLTVVTRYGQGDNLESLFISFLNREKGAKIFLKAGLIPAKMPERDIIVNESEVRGSK